uniref:Reverse transcriptase Ty1/copia-type domain-containing protein n=1 Tax=Cannabis sativa TaxID=3483 RepID=A0A803QFD1_CANSA
MLSIANQFNMEIDQMDVTTTFLHGDLEEEIYMEQPKGFEIKGKKEMVYKLVKSLYGLKQAPRQWNRKFDAFMINHEFNRSYHDTYLYYKGSSIKDVIYLLLYVDDMLILSQEISRVDMVKDLLKTKFEMKDLGNAFKILGISI